MTFPGDLEFVFLDVGGVLYHDEPVELYYLSRLARLVSADATELFTARERLLRSGVEDWLHTWGRDFAGSEWDRAVATAWDATLAALDRLCIPCPGALEALTALARRYRLGCIANQPAQARSLLHRLGFAPHLELILLDAEIGISKPDPRIFQQGLAALNAPPARTAFIGDRLDNDIVPARQLGMRTVWLRRTPRHFQPEGVEPGFATAYHASLQRLWHHNRFTSQDPADLIGEELAALGPALAGA